jgi:NhaB family Na+:H+ antiporter
MPSGDAAMLKIFAHNFLGKTPNWYKFIILAFLASNPVVFYCISPFVAGWMILIEFIFTLGLALKCYPVPSGGLLALEAIIMGIATPAGVYKEITANLPTLLLLIFMVAGIYYIKDVIVLVFTKLLITFRKKYLVCFLFCLINLLLAAFLDALTLMATIIAVCFNFYAIYHRVAGAYAESADKTTAGSREFEEMRGFLRNIIMHSGVGMTLGGTMTIVGEPQNLMIGTLMDWSFLQYVSHNAIISVPVAIAGLLLCPLIEILKIPGFGYQLPEKARQIIVSDYEKNARQISRQSVYVHIVQAVIGVLLILALAFHVAEIGLIGIALIIIVTAFTGVNKEHDYSGAFSNAMPFVLLIIIFFAVLAVVHEQHLITPLVRWVFTFEGQMQLLALFFVNGILSCFSDSVFIASVFISEVENAYAAGAFTHEWLERLAVVVNMGTNIPSVATPNGQASFLFLLTSALAPILKLSYLEMVKLTLPYTLILTSTGAVAIAFFL